MSKVESAVMTGDVTPPHREHDIKALDLIRDHVNFDLPASPIQGEEWLSLPELPTARELNPDGDSDATRAEVMVHLRRNDVTQPYSSKLQYLETHYRLNREEGITFLRFGISEYKYDPLMMDNNNTCVYTKVFVQGYLMMRLGPICRVQFSTERAGKKIRWQTSQRLTPGTVVAISTAANNFKTICKPAVVADRPIRNGLDQKPPTIQLLWANIEDAVIDPTEELVIIESTRGFFEAVRHTLIGLQHVARSTSPLLKYLVQGSDGDYSPQYVLDHSIIDVSPILHHLPEDKIEKARLLSAYHNCEVLEGIPNEIGKYTSLDNSQLQAVHRILTKELAIVQGPPGTGKTFTSVESLRCMISTLTASMTKQPDEVIVVAAETNHAVDQILSHLINFDIKVVRLGGRTRDEGMKKYSLFNLRDQAMPGRSRDMNKLESARRRTISEIEAIITEMFPGELLSPDLLLEHGLITKEQSDSLARDEWTWKPAPGNPSGIMSEWLDHSLQDISIRLRHDPVFGMEEEIFEDDDRDGIDAANFELDADNSVLDTDDDTIHLRGTWLGVNRQWAGSNPYCYPMSSFHIQRQLKKKDLYEIDNKWRGLIYEYWQSELLSKRSRELSRLFSNYTRICKNVKVNGWKRDMECIKSMGIQIVGCTTTGLSKYRGLLASLKPKTILIEEAAQSREAHIAAALLPTLQQLILVGDHQQLVPHCDVAGLADNYHNLTVSMFERLVSCLELPYTMLNQQRRMIPEIRAVLDPFYPGLGDHPVVLDKLYRPDVPGMAMNSYLFSHTWVEGTDPETMSKYNEPEAEMIVRFALYLIQNGVLAKQITILTFYRGQRKKILRLVRRYGSSDVGQINVFTVDSYQGEENDIVLLSLVRSNAPKRPSVAGFVGDTNRGVVSISRARRGFYIFGNIRNLEHATETSRFMWGNVRQTFERLGRYDSVQSRLPLRCQKHGNTTYAVDAEHFQTIHGGCHEKCTELFEPCGHACERLCHPMPHEKLICQHPCERELRCGHGCTTVCGNECECERSCPDFMARTKHLRKATVDRHELIRRRDLHPSEYSYNDPPFINHWSGWNGAVDDAKRRSASKYGHSINNADRPVEATPEKARDVYRPVKFDNRGQREVGDSVVIDGEVRQVEHVISQVDGLVDFTGLNFHPNVSQGGRGQGRGRGAKGTRHNKFNPQSYGLQTDGSLEDIYNTTPHRESAQNSGILHSNRIEDLVAPCSLPPDTIFQQVSEVKNANSITRTVKEWENSESEEEPLSARIRQLAVEAAARPPGDDEKDLITF